MSQSFAIVSMRVHVADRVKGLPNSVISSYNRNFTGRLDGNKNTEIFISSPEIVVAKTFAGDLRFDPTRDAIAKPDGSRFSFDPPWGESLPVKYEETSPSHQASSELPQSEVKISSTSDRLQRLVPFQAWSGQDYKDLPILIKIKGLKFINPS